MKAQRDPLEDFRDEVKRRLNLAGVPCYINTKFCHGRQALNDPCKNCDSAAGCRAINHASVLFLKLQTHVAFWKKAFPGVIDEQTETRLNKITQDEIEKTILSAAKDRQTT